MSLLQDIVARAGIAPESIGELSAEIMWSKHGTTIWKAERFIGYPSFYPVYSYNDYYSYSLLPLIILKGGFRLNSCAVTRVPKDSRNYYSGNDTIDAEINRIGGPLKPKFIIKDSREYAKRLSEAMCKDIKEIEKTHPGYTNIILCGGKDSLNLTLLPWKNHVLIVSAPPNYQLVKKFISENGLNYDIVQLRDDDDSLIECEILSNCCRNSLEHCRWGPHLRELSQDLSGKVIFWKGQAGEQLMTSDWKKYTYKHPPYGRILEVCRPFKGRGKYKLQKLLEYIRCTQRLLFGYLWHRTAMWQGAHMSILRELTDSLVLSAYHGPYVEAIFSQVDWKCAVQEDLRPLIGKYLRGKKVLYPTTNPGPPLSKIRKDKSNIETFLKVLRSTGIAVQEN